MFPFFDKTDMNTVSIYSYLFFSIGISRCEHIFTAIYMLVSIKKYISATVRLHDGVTRANWLDF